MQLASPATDMLKKLMASALFAGFVAGLIAAALQLYFVVPVILEAELYETGQVVHFGGAPEVEHSAEHAHDHDEHSHEASEGGSNLTRHLTTVASVIITYFGYGLIMVAGFALARRAGHVVTPRTGLIWGFLGFLAVQLAPAAGLPPELPGSSAADLQLRQIWWIFAVAASISGFAAIGLGRNWTYWGLGVALLLIPHLIGAPHPEAFFGVAPPELAGHFAGRSLAVGAAGWTLLGLTAAYFWQKETA